jgi:hypothetical protein
MTSTGAGGTLGGAADLALRELGRGPLLAGATLSESTSVHYLSDSVPCYCVFEPLRALGLCLQNCTSHVSAASLVH